MSATSGMDYAPQGKPAPACAEGEFVIAAVGLDHGHINGMCNGLTEAGAQLKWVYDADAGKSAALARQFPGARVATSEAEVLQDPEVQLVAATIPADHAALGTRVMTHGKDYFSDKPALTTLTQLEEVKRVVEETGRKYAVYFSERLHVESAVCRRPDSSRRAPWAGPPGHGHGAAPGQPERTAPLVLPTRALRRGSSATSGATRRSSSCTSRATVMPGSLPAGWPTTPTRHPGMEDFGDCSLAGENGASGYFRVDWFTPDGLSTWGDGRTFLLGTDGYIELRKYVDIATGTGGDHVYLVDGAGEHRIGVQDKVGYPFFGELVRDCLDRTERAMTQDARVQGGRAMHRGRARSRAPGVGRLE